MALERAKERPPRAALKRRHEEVVQLLAACGLWRGPRRLARGAGAPDREELRARRLRAALERLGPVFSSFGLYMATRVDLLPSEDRLELAAIADRAAALPPPAVRGRLMRELGRAPEEVFRAVEETPLASRLLSQTHRAWLVDGRPVTVELLRPEAEESLARDAELLHLLKVAFGGRAGTDPALDGAIDDFRSVLGQKADLLRAAAALETLALDAEDFGTLRIPRVHRPLCTRGMLTVERLPGVSLSEVPPPVPREAGANAGSFGGLDRDDVARRLCTVWLRQAMLGSLFPVELTPEAVTILPNKQIALAGGVFASLPPEARTNLWGYLIAASSEDPNRACSYLLEELAGDDSAGGADQLRQRFRQLAPFRDAGWDGGDSNSLAARLCAHWKLAGECGRLPRPAAASFYRGALISAGLARWLAPGRDSLTEALQDVRLIAGLEKLRAMAGPDQLADQLNRYAAAAVDLPQRLDEALTLAAAGDARLKLQMPQTAERRARKNSSARVTALLLVLAAFVVWSRSPAAPLAGPWADGVEAFVFVALGALVLRAASRV